MDELSPDDVGLLRHVRETGRIVQLPMPIFIKLLGLGLLVVSAGRTWRLTASGDAVLDSRSREPE